jgi:pantoate--beta-alanine ligase
MSSRNNYLTTEQRISALSLYKSFQKSKELINSGIRDAATIIDAATKLIQSYSETDIDYIAICDPETLEDIKTIDRTVVMALAVKVGKARLIDNMILNQ